jgi:peptide/histidine transporter 3/4
VEVAERFAYYDISSNLLSYLTDLLSQTTAAAAAINTWSAAASLLSLIGVALAKSLLGRPSVLYNIVIPPTTAPHPLPPRYHDSRPRCSLQSSLPYSRQTHYFSDTFYQFQLLCLPFDIMSKIFFVASRSIGACYIIMPLLNQHM